MKWSPNACLFILLNVLEAASARFHGNVEEEAVPGLGDAQYTLGELEKDHAALGQRLEHLKHEEEVLHGHSSAAWRYCETAAELAVMIAREREAWDFVQEWDRTVSAIHAQDTAEVDAALLAEACDHTFLRGAQLGQHLSCS